MTHYVDIDAHAGDLLVRVLDHHADEINQFTIANDALGFERLSDPLRSHDRGGIEACDAAYPLIELLRREGTGV